jgi:3-methyl-2-oxobutanoate hydroxymethyltransferase
MPSVRDLLARGPADDPITVLTAYDTPTARIVDDAGVDVILVGDSIGDVVLGHDSALPVGLDTMATHTAAVARGADDALVIADLPFLSYGVSQPESLRNAGRLLTEAGAGAVKIESGPHTVELTRRLVELGIPVQAHLGLTPQHVNRVGLQRQGTDAEAAAEILDLAEAHEDAGAFSLVLEHVPANLAAVVTDELDIPTIGIGAGPETDGQVLVINDAVGLSERAPPFATAFGDVRGEMVEAVEAYRDAVESGSFPGEAETHVEEGLELE